MRAMVFPIKMFLSGNIIIGSLISGALISVIASISPVLKTSRINIIEAIKYE